MKASLLKQLHQLLFTALSFGQRVNFLAPASVELFGCDTRIQEGFSNLQSSAPMPQISEALWNAHFSLRHLHTDTVLAFALAMNYRNANDDDANHCYKQTICRLENV